MTIDPVPLAPGPGAPAAPQDGKKVKKEPTVWTEATMLMALRRRYDEKQGWLLIEHVGDNTGFDRVRTADAVAMHTWPSRGYETIGFEVKISRSDWQRELKKPEKAGSIQQYCHRWYLVVSDAAIVKPGELPLGWGLIAPRGDGLVIVTEADKREPTAKTDGFLAAMLRATMKRSVSAKELEQVRLVGYDQGWKAAKENSKHEIKRMEKDRDEHKAMIDTFEVASGVDMRQRWMLGDIGAAVKLVRSGGLDSLEARAIALLESSRSITSSLEGTVGAVAAARAQRLSAETAIARGEEPAPAPPKLTRAWE